MKKEDRKIREGMRLFFYGDGELFAGFRGSKRSNQTTS